MNLCWFRDRWNIVIIIILYARYIKGIFFGLDVLVGKSSNVCTHELHVYYIKQIFEIIQKRILYRACM